MLDESDLDFAILVSARRDGDGWLFSIIVLVFVLIVAAIVALNENECAQKHCLHGKPVLMHHECLCVEEPTP